MFIDVNISFNNFIIGKFYRWLMLYINQIATAMKRIRRVRCYDENIRKNKDINIYELTVKAYDKNSREGLMYLELYKSRFYKDY